jgi:hypothetical protein
MLEPSSVWRILDAESSLFLNMKPMPRITSDITANTPKIGANARPT